MMGTELLALLFGLGSAASWGAGDFSGGLATKRSDVFMVVMISQVAGTVPLVIFTLFWGGTLPPASHLLLGGIGGLFGTQVLGLTGAQASIVGVGFGGAGGALAWIMFRFLYSSETESPYSQEDLIGRDAYVLVSIPRTAWGTISLEVEGTTQQFRATASEDIERGVMVRIKGVAGNGLIVVPPPAEVAPTSAPLERRYLTASVLPR